MKYLYDTSEQKNVTDEEYLIDWRKRCNEYEKQYKKIRKRLPENFLSKYEKQYFHDYKIEDILISKEANKRIVRLYIRNKEDKITLIYDDVSIFKCDIHYEHCVDFVDFLLDEFDIADNGLLSHEISVSGGKNGYIYTEFKNLFLKNTE